MEQHEVAVTVFATVPGVDPRDSTRRLEGALYHRMPWNGKGYTLPESRTGEELPVHMVIGAAEALGEGYLRAEVTPKARRESRHD